MDFKGDFSVFKRRIKGHHVVFHKEEEQSSNLIRRGISAILEAIHFKKSYERDGIRYFINSTEYYCLTNE